MRQNATFFEGRGRSSQERLHPTVISIYHMRSSRGGILFAVLVYIDHHAILHRIGGDAHEVQAVDIQGFVEQGARGVLLHHGGYFLSLEGFCPLFTYYYTHFSEKVKRENSVEFLTKSAITKEYIG